jgi:hypothetical protein
MKYGIVIAAIILVISIQCSGPKNICKKAERIDGEVIYAIPSPGGRTVTLETKNGRVIIYRVPLEQPLYNIPVCKHRGKYYWVMP